MNPVELERRLQRIERQLDELASAGRPRVRSGTWTPELYGATTYGTTTYASRAGQYTLINRICFAWIVVWWTSTTATGQARISLPIASSSAYMPYYVFSLYHHGFTYTNGATLRTYVPANEDYVTINEITSSSTTNLQVPPQGLLAFAGCYEIN